MARSVCKLRVGYDQLWNEFPVGRPSLDYCCALAKSSV